MLDHPKDCLVTLANTAFRLEALATHPGESPWACTGSFEALWAQADPPPDRIQLRLLSPAAFRAGGVRNVLFPEAGLVLGGLLDKWNAFCPPGLQLPADKERLSALLQVDSYSLATRALDFGTYRETGVTGWCSYRFEATASQEERRWAGALAAFAFYAGVGAKTTMGMGQARARSPKRS